MSLESKIEKIEDDLCEESDQVIRNLLGDKLSEDKINNLTHSLLHIFHLHTNRLYDYIESDNAFSSSTYNYYNNNNCNPNLPINLFLVNLPSAPSRPQYYNYLQPQMAPAMIPNPNYYSQQQTFSQLPLQQPNFPYFNQFGVQNPFILNQKTKYKSKEMKSSKKSKHKHKKSHEKSKKTKDSDESNSKIQVFNVKPGNQFDGIIKYLTDKTGGNIHSNGTIELTSNSVANGSFDNQEPKNLLDFSANTCYGAKSGAMDFCVCFDFKNMKVKITDYAIKSYRYNSGHLKSWILEISDDNKSWTKIDEHTNDSSLNGSNKIATFKVKNKSNFSRYCRLRHSGEFWDYKSFASPGFSQIEFYGSLKSEGI